MSRLSRYSEIVPAPLSALPKSKRDTLEKLLLDGVSLREIARMTGLSKDAVLRYKHKVIVPAVQTAVRIQQAEQVTAVAPSGETNRDIARQIVQTSPVRSRLDALWNKIDGFIAKAEITDVAPLINQAHKNVELLGRVTGELNDSSGSPATMSVQLMNILMMPIKRDRPEPAKIVDAGPECSDQSS